MLLKNDSDLLPVKKAKKISVVGENAYKKMCIGGGSSMDTAKAIGIIINNPEFADVRSLEGVAPTKNPCVPIIAVPTTAGTAAEVTINYVITDVQNNRKMVCVDVHDIPVIAFVDPDMMSTMPAGLTAAYQLAVKGHAVTVMDMMPEMGGMLRYGIPEYRLPKAVLAAEVKQIEDLGVVLCNNVKVGKDVTLEALRESYDAVLVAVGAWKSTGVGCEGDKLEGVMGGIDLLREVNLGGRPNLGKNVAVVGGGNVAMDACRTAVRLGAENVYVIYRRTRAEAPAEDLEIEEALEEGVNFKWLTNPAEIIGENGKVTQIKLQVMELGEPDASGRRSPVPVEGKFEILDVDTVISAIGQRCALEGFEALELTRKGTIVADERSGSTNIPGVFAVGDATNRGPSIAVRAIGEANEAAEAIDAYLAGAEWKAPNPYYSKRKVTSEDFADRQKLARAEMSCKDPSIRRGNFDAVINGFTEEQARNEAKRCLECGCHDFYDCKLIKNVNRYELNPGRFAGDKRQHGSEKKLVVIERDEGKCILCGLCVRVCEEVAKEGLLGLVGRGFTTVIKPEFRDTAKIAKCATCLKCAEACPTGALKILK